MCFFLFITTDRVNLILKFNINKKKSLIDMHKQSSSHAFVIFSFNSISLTYLIGFLKMSTVDLFFFFFLKFKVDLFNKQIRSKHRSDRRSL